MARPFRSSASRPASRPAPRTPVPVPARLALVAVLVIAGGPVVPELIPDAGPAPVRVAPFRWLPELVRTA